MTDIKALVKALRKLKEEAPIKTLRQHGASIASPEYGMVFQALNGNHTDAPKLEFDSPRWDSQMKNIGYIVELVNAAPELLDAIDRYQNDGKFLNISPASYRGELIALINTEIDWCNTHPMEDQVSPEFRRGFVKGLEQARDLIVSSAYALHNQHKT